MSGTKQSRDVKKWMAGRRAQFRLKQSLDYIDFVFDVLEPEKEALVAGNVRAEFEGSNGEIAESAIQMTLKDERKALDAPDSDSTD